MSKTEWTPEALDAHWSTSRGYAWRLVNGEKPWSLERQLSLPRDVRAYMAKLEAEQHGFIVTPPLYGTAAQQAFVAGFLGLFANQLLPARADHMAHAHLEQQTAEKKTA